MFAFNPSILTRINTRDFDDKVSPANLKCMKVNKRSKNVFSFLEVIYVSALTVNAIYRYTYFKVSASDEGIGPTLMHS